MSHLGLRRKSGLIILLAGLSCLLLAVPSLAGYEPDPSTPRADLPAGFQ